MPVCASNPAGFRGDRRCDTMLHQILFLAVYLGLLPVVLVSPFAGVLIYYWLDYLPPEEVYSVTLLPGYLSLTTGALSFVMWLFLEKKTLPRPLLVMLLMAALLLWVNITSLYALVPNAATFEWIRTVKVIGFAILTTQMMSTRARLEAFVWAFVLSTIYFSVPSAIKVIFSGGSGGIGTGEVVVGAWGSFFGDRVTLSVVMSMAVPFALYLGRQTTLLPVRLRRFLKPAMLGTAGSCLIAVIGTFARTGLLAGGATLLMLGIRSKRKVLSIFVVVAVALALFLIAPENWLMRMDTIIHYQHDNSAVDRLAAWKWAWELVRNRPLVGGGFGVFVLDAGSIPGRGGWVEAHNIFFQMMGEHGFIGLALFCALIVAIYRSCAVVQKQVRGRDELAWTADLARATQIGLVAYIVGGSFVSIATTPFLFILAAIAVGTRSLVQRELSTLVRNSPLVASHAVPQPAE
jgi:probable O-glycosylation ligase (exosortase A-associated)